MCTNSYAERGGTITVLECVNSSGLSIPPIVIFKAARMVDGLGENMIPGSSNRLSKTGWINTELLTE